MRGTNFGRGKCLEGRRPASRLQIMGKSKTSPTCGFVMMWRADVGRVKECHGFRYHQIDVLTLGEEAGWHFASLGISS